MSLLQRYQNNPDIQVHPSADGKRFTAKYKHLGVDFNDPYVRMARGIVLDSEGNIIARPFDKFFNLDQPTFMEDDHLSEWEDTRFTVKNKFDGSLAIAYAYKGELYVGSTGNPDMVLHGVSIKDRFIELHPNQDEHELARILEDLHLTLLFEYVSPNNQIVAHYNKEEFILIGARALDGFDFLTSLNDTTKITQQFKQAETLPLRTKEEVLDYVNANKPEEGVVVTFAGGKMVKVKTPAYISEHGLKTSLKPNTRNGDLKIVCMCIGDVIDDYLASLPKNGFINRDAVHEVSKEVFKYREEYWSSLGRLNKICESMPKRDAVAECRHRFKNPIMLKSLLDMYKGDANAIKNTHRSVQYIMNELGYNKIIDENKVEETLAWATSSISTKE